jgi:hypothetical protein
MKRILAALFLALVVALVGTIGVASADPPPRREGHQRRLGDPGVAQTCSATSRRSSDLYFFLYCRPNPLADASAGGFRVQAAHNPHLPQKSDRTG